MFIFHKFLKLCYSAVTIAFTGPLLELYSRSIKPDLSDRGKAAARKNWHSVLFSRNGFSTVNL